MTLQRLLIATVFTTVSIAVNEPSRPPDLLTLIVTDATTGRPVPHPMICLREFRQPIGPIGDSTGRVSVGGSLPTGTLHLRIKAPSYLDFDTTANWPSASEIRVKLKRRSGPPTSPQCESGS